MIRKLTAIIQPEEGGFVSLCPELDIASQGDSVDEATANLREALELFLGHASQEEIQRRYARNVITQLEVAVG